MLNPFIYERIVPIVDEYVEKHLKPYVDRRPSRFKRSVLKWGGLTNNDKYYILELVERLQKQSIVKAMLRGDSVIPIPRVGRFEFSPAKYFYASHKQELSELSKEELKKQIIEYHIKHKRKRRNSTEDGKKVCFGKNITKG